MPIQMTPKNSKSWSFRNPFQYAVLRSVIISVGMAASSYFLFKNLNAQVLLFAIPPYATLSGIRMWGYQKLGVPKEFINWNFRIVAGGITGLAISGIVGVAAQNDWAKSELSKLLGDNCQKPKIELGNRVQPNSLALNMVRNNEFVKKQVSYPARTFT